MSNVHFETAVPTRLYESEISVPIAAARYGLDPAAIDDFSLNVNPFGPPASAAEAARASVARCGGYPDTRLTKLRTALARRHGVDPDQLFFGAGLDDVIKLTIQAWAGANDAVLVHVPTFPRYELEARLHGCNIVAVRSDPPWHIDVAAIERELAARQTAIAFLCTPNNPTGATIATEDARSLAKRFLQTIFVVDEALGNPLREGAMPLAATSPNIVVLRTFSKAFGLAGLRVGYAVGPAALLARAERGRPPFNVAVTGEAAAIAALEDADFIVRSQARFRDEAECFARRLEGVSSFAIRGSHANMLLLEIASGSATACVEALAAQGLLVADARCFGDLGGHEAIRVSLRDRAANERLLRALERLA